MELKEIYHTYTQSGNKKAFMKDLKKILGIKKIHKRVEPYLFGEVELPENGIFTIEPFETSLCSFFTYDALFNRFGERLFPAVSIGCGSGVDFWLLLESGKIISLHYDASFDETASSITAETPEEFLTKFTAAGSLFTITPLLALQQRSASLDTEDAHFERVWIMTVADALGWSLSRLKTYIYHLPMEPFFSPAASFIEDNGLDELIMAEKKVKKFRKGGKASADLSFCFLHTVPPELEELKELESLNLSGNHQLGRKDSDVTPLMKSRLKQLDLSECGLNHIPALPDTLVELDLRDNLISQLSSLKACTALKVLHLKGNPVKGEEIESLKNARPGLVVLFENVDCGDYSECEELDLSYKNLTRLPDELKTAVNLKRLSLEGNYRLNFSEAFTQLAQWSKKLMSLDISNCALTSLPEELFLLTGLEELNIERGKFFGGKEENRLDSKECFFQLSRLPKLKNIPIREYSVSEQDFERYLETLPLYTGLTSLHCFPESTDKEMWQRVIAVLKTMSVSKLVFNGINLFAAPDRNTANIPFQVEDVKELTQIKSLEWHAWGSSQTTIPESIFDFPALEELVIAGSCYIKTLPDGVARLKGLKKLEFTGSPPGYVTRECKITDKISELTQLEELKISNFYIHAIPDSISRLSRLTKLEISDCEWIEQLPSLIHVTGLRELLANRSDLKSLPADIDTLEQLEVLELSGSMIKSLPERLGRLRNLKRLHLNVDSFNEELPASFKELQNLEELSLSGTGLNYSEVLKSIACLSSLKKLHIYETQDEGECLIPAEFAGLDNLKELLFYHSGIMQNDATQLFSVISKLKNLEFLDLRFYGTGTCIKESTLEPLGDFPALKSIRLLAGRVPDHVITELFEQLSRITTLKKIDAHQGLSFLPATIGKLTSLEELQISSTGIDRYPPELLEMKHLKILDIRCNIPKSEKKKIEKALPYTKVFY